MRENIIETLNMVSEVRRTPLECQKWLNDTHKKGTRDLLRLRPEEEAVLRTDKSFPSKSRD